MQKILFFLFFLAALVSATDVSEEVNHQDEYISLNLYEDKEYLDFGAVRKNKKKTLDKRKKNFYDIEQYILYL